jgi:hypothetical protein
MDKDKDEKIKKLEDEVNILREKLKKYTNGNNNKRFYEKNKEKINQKATERLKKLAEENPEKLKEYRKNAYLKRKEKIKEQKLENNIII